MQFTQWDTQPTEEGLCGAGSRRLSSGQFELTQYTSTTWTADIVVHTISYGTVALRLEAVNAS